MRTFLSRPQMGQFMARLYRPGRRLAPVVAGVMAAGLLVAVRASAPVGPWSAPTPDDVSGVAVQPVPLPDRPTWSASGREAKGDEPVNWPAPGSAVVDLRAPARSPAVAAPSVRAGDLPVYVAASDSADPNAVTKARVEVLDRAASASAGIGGVVIRVGRADGVTGPGTIRVTVDYSGFANAYGGDWASRLRLINAADGRPLAGRNNVTTSTVSAEVSLTGGGAMLLAASAGPSGDNGDYSATSLSPAGTWQVSQQTGDFAWTYPLRVPPAVGGPEPQLALSYSSGSLDGRTGATNTQGSWIGDGWDMWPGYIERRYKSCSDDKDAVAGEDPNNKNVYGGDQCWLNATGNATMSLNGRATELVRSSGNTWKGTADDGSKIELLTNSSFANGDDNNEYWKVTTPDGTQYFFGRNRRPGWSTGKAESKSVWTSPVYGNHEGEPGYTEGDFAASRRTQAWRWNLDYVLDPHGNSMTYFYQRETGAYGREGDPDKRTTYHRGGWLDSIEYGTRTSTEYTEYPAAKVLIDEADRCVATCYDSGGDPVKSNWKDTPWDQYCKAAPCTDQLAPTFWTQKRISKIRTQVHRGSGSYSDVESWTLAHEYLDAGSNEGKPMWLRGITRTGHVTTAGGSSVSDPQIVFDPGSDALPNRVDGPADGRSMLARYRISTITTESGAQISPTYSAVECTRATLPTPHNNGKRCFPQYYAPEGETPTLDWFHKYRVTRVDVYDQGGGFSHEQTNYDYLDAPAWHYDDSELVEEKKRTWGQFKGYGKVRVRKGLETGIQSVTEYLYLRGMDGDKQPSATRDVWVTDSQGRAVEDHEAYSGMLLEETVLLGAGGSWISGTVNTPVKQGPTATSGPLKAWMTNTGTVRQRLKLADSSTRWTKTVTTFNSDNLPTQVDDLGDESTPADDTCTRTWYARNASNWMLDKVKRTETVGVNCSATPALPADMQSGTRTTYDAEANNWDTYLPAKGDVAKVEEIDSWNGTTPVWLTTSRSAYDSNGRTTETWDALNQRTATAYTPALAGPVTATTATNPAGHTATSTMEPAWNLPTSIVDNANSTRTDLVYDGLGRLLKVWLPGRAKASQTPNLEFAYLVRNDAPTAVTTKKLLPTGAGYKTSITLYDGLLRQRQTQTQAPGGGRILTDDVYDSRGLLEWRSTDHYDESGTPPDTTLVTTIGQPVIPAYTTFEYDGAGRQTAEVLRDQGTEKWRTTTLYAGGRTSIIPPEGGTATTTIVDARGQTVERRQYKSPGQVGSNDPALYDRTTYTYTDRGDLATVTDPAGNTWRFEYDQRGRKIRDEDPDKGVTTSTYDGIGQLVTITDDRDVTLAYTYDSLGHKTSAREGSTTGPVRAEWVYGGLANGAGKLTRSIRYEPAGSTTQYVSEVVGYDLAGRPTGTRITIPSGEGGLCAAGGSTPCSYTYTTTYRADGQTFTTGVPASAGLPGETLVFNYNDVGAPTTLLSGLGTYVYSVVYNKIGQLTQRTLGAVGKRTALTYTIDETTARLAETLVSPENKPSPAKFSYEYDDAGTLTSITDTPFGQPTDTQCYRYDYLKRLSDAWTPSGDCDADPSVAGLGGPAPYWHSYGYDLTGNRTAETRHGTTDVERTYLHPAAGGAPGSRPHAVSRVDVTGGVSQNYEYDETGNTTCRPATAAANTCPNGTGSQVLTWDGEGHLASSVDSSGTTSYVYDADGNRLIRRDPAGATLYLPGGTEVRKPVSGSGTATRFYSHLDATIAMRTSAGVSWLVGDHHNTAEIALAGADLTVARRRTLPFGETRGTLTGTWPSGMDKGFLSGTLDNTGLTHLGAREYDAALGRFISVDPVVDPNDPQTLHSYSYGWNNPATFADPDGQWPGWVKKAASAVANTAAKTVDVVASAATTAASATANFVKDTVNEIKQDPWKFAAGVAVGIAATVAVAAVCSTGVGCIILAGAVAGAAAAGAEYGVDVAQGDKEFSVSELATTMVVGGVVGGATAGLGVAGRKVFDKVRGRFGSIDLYHGTSKAGADAIRRDGIDLSRGRPDADFGPGFYTTKNRAQAEAWAARNPGGEVLHYRVPRGAFGGLSTLRFGSANSAWERFVMGFRTRTAPMHRYDVVEGPMILNHRDVLSGGARPRPGGHQMSFHTSRAAGMLNRYLL